MTLNIQLKRSAQLDSAPSAGQLDVGELGLNYNKDSMALYAKDSDGVIRQIAGSGSESGYWELSGTTLSPVDNTYGINIGGGNIELNASDGSATFAGGNINFYSNGSGTFNSGASFGGSVLIKDGSTTKISLANDGSITTDSYVRAGGNPNNGANVGLAITNNGGLISAVSTGAAAALKVYQQGSSTETFKVLGDGSATFGGQVESQSGGFKFPDGTIQLTAATGSGGVGTLQEVTDAGNFTTNDIGIGGTSSAPNITIGKSGYITIKRAGGSSTVLNGYNGATQTSNLNSDGLLSLGDGGQIQLDGTDGSITADGQIRSNDKFFVIDTDGAQLSRLTIEPTDDAVVMTALNTAGTGRDVFFDVGGNGVNIGGTVSSPNIELKNTGAATFSGSISSNINGGMISINGSSGNNLIQCSTADRATALGMWAGGESRLYSTGGMKFGINATANDGTAPTGYTDAAVIDSSGNFLIGGTLPSTPNIELKGSDGSASFAGGNLQIQSGGQVINAQGFQAGGSPNTGTAGSSVGETGQIAATAASNENVFTGRQVGGTTPTVEITGSGQGSFAGTVLSTGTSNASVLFDGQKTDGYQAFQVLGDGSGTFGGVVESESGGFKFPDGTTQTTAATGSGGAGTLQEVTDAGNTTTNSIDVGGITSAADASINGVAFGKGAGTGNGLNTAAGLVALGSNTTGDNNTAVGWASLFKNEDGKSNTSVGANNLANNVSGNHNTSVGHQSLLNNVDGADNTSYGFNALQQNVSGTYNTAVGSQAGLYIEGSSNTILGAYEGTASDSSLSDTVIISAGTAERARCDSSGNWSMGGKVTSAATVSSDSDQTLTTKGYVDTAIVDSSGTLTAGKVLEDGTLVWGKNTVASGVTRTSKGKYQIVFENELASDQYAVTAKAVNDYNSNSSVGPGSSIWNVTSTGFNVNFYGGGGLKDQDFIYGIIGPEAEAPASALAAANPGGPGGGGGSISTWGCIDGSNSTSWVNPKDGVLAGLNIASVVRTDKGKFTVTFEQPYANANYSLVVNPNLQSTIASGSAAYAIINEQTATGFNVTCKAGSGYNDYNFNFMITSEDDFAAGTDAWANVELTTTNGPCVVPASFNTTSVTRTGTGVYEVVFTAELPITNYSVVATGFNPPSGSAVRIACYDNLSTTGFTIVTRNGNGDKADGAFNFQVSATGDQSTTTSNSALASQLQTALAAIQELQSKVQTLEAGAGTT